MAHVVKIESRASEDPDIEEVINIAAYARATPPGHAEEATRFRHGAYNVTPKQTRGSPSLANTPYTPPGLVPPADQQYAASPPMPGPIHLHGDITEPNDFRPPPRFPFQHISQLSSDRQTMMAYLPTSLEASHILHSYHFVPLAVQQLQQQQQWIPIAPQPPRWPLYYHPEPPPPE